MTRARSLSRLLNPASIAFIGGGECDVAIRKTLGLGFPGEIWAVHPKRDTVGGVAALKDAAQIDGAPDAAFVAVKREPAIEIVRTLSAKGCGGAVIYASGFSETGDGHLQQALLEAANGMPLMGPNCYGFVNGLARAALWPDEHGVAPRESGVAIVTQSGNIACNFTMTRRALPLAAVFAIGNQADVDMARMVEALTGDPRVTAIGLHIEGLADVAAFAEAALKARAARKPIVALKTGRSEQGAKVAMGHTASLAGADQLYDALFERCGVARVDSVTAFAETLKLLHHGGPLTGGRLVSMSCSGGEAALVADMAMGRAVSFPPFGHDTAAKVKATLNDYVAVDNPLDYHTFIWNQEEKLAATFSAVLSGGFDAGFVILDTPTHPDANPATWLVTAKALKTAALNTGARAAIVSSLPECFPLDLADDLAAADVAPMFGLDDALTALEAAARIGLSWARAIPQPLSLAPQPVAAKTALEEVRAKRLLNSFGLAIPRGETCAASDAVMVAGRIGYPITLKVSSAAIAHKTELGGVALNLKTPEDVAAAAIRLGKLAPDLLVEEMVQGAVAELIVGLKRDPQFGLALVIGAGGVLTELLRDAVSLLLPASRDDIVRALRSLKIHKLIAGFRNKRGDEAAVIAAIEAVAAFAAAHSGAIHELDINPLLVLPDRAVAVDAYLIM